MRVNQLCHSHVGRRDNTQSRYNLAMRFGSLASSLLILMFTFACTMYRDHPASSMAEATGGEDMEQVFWKHLQAGNWTELERSLASNYVGMMASGTLDRDATMQQYHQWKLKDFAIGDLKTEMNGSTIVVTYTIAMKGTAADQPLPSAPQHMMSVWQEQKKGWVMIAHSVIQP